MKVKSYIPFILFLVLLSFLIGIASLLLGRYAISINDLKVLLHSFFDENIEASPNVKTVLFQIRLPRVLAAFLVGGTLSITGATYQGMFRNPMVSPSILGVSAGAGFGAALSIVLGLGIFMLQGFAFLFGILAVAAVYAISHSTGKKFDKCLTLILSGMIVSAVFAALISILKYVADPNDALPSIVYWLMGGLSEIEMKDLYFIASVALPGLLLLSLFGWKLDMLSFGDEEAKTMGLEVNRIRLMVIVTATLMTAAAISISGIVGWVGLIIPHVARMLVGPKNSDLLPTSFLIGGIFLLIVDGISRTISSMEIPLGITTSLIGAPFFIYVLISTAKK